LGIASNLRDYWRIAAGVRAYSRQPIASNLAEAVRRQVEEREETWLALVRQAIFAAAGHPYKRLFDLAGCRFGDLEQSVRANGLERTLEELYDGGVYLTVDEFKGKTPIVRQGREIASRPADFHNLLADVWIDVATGGSSGPRTAVPNGTGALLLRDAISALLIAEFELRDYARLIVRPILPSSVGVMMGLSMSRMGCPMHRWFATGGSAKDSLHYRALTRYLVQAGRWNGASMPAPEYLAPGDFATPVEWIAREKQNGRPAMLSAFVSPAIRMAALARERGLDVEGTLVSAGGETINQAKLDVFKQAGMLYSSRYWISEIGPIATGCRNMLNQGRAHLMANNIAVISRLRPQTNGPGSVNALLFTSVSPLCASVLINAEMGDTATLAPSNCDCSLSRAGLGWEVRDITSYSKLTGQGMTLSGADVVALLEEHLPRRCGGAPADYQLVERHGAGQTQMELRVSPRAGVKDLAAVRHEFISGLRGVYGGSLATRVWEHSGGLTVVEEEPFATPAGKVLPLHLASSQAQNRESHEP
jgi:hypothetical protein